MLDQACKVVFNKDRNYFELRMPDGSTIPAQIEMKLEEELPPDSRMRVRFIATVRLYVEWGGEVSPKTETFIELEHPYSAG